MSILKRVIERKGRPHAPQLELSVFREETSQICRDTRMDDCYERRMELRLSTQTVCTDDEYRGHVRIIMARSLLRALYGDVHAMLSEIATAVSMGDRRGALKLIAELEREIDNSDDLPTELKK